jgi:hypothetical protein
MLVMAIDTQDVVMGTCRVLAGRCMMAVIGGEVVSGALIANGVPGAAGIRSVAPLEARGTLTSGGGDCPREASSNDTYKCN